MAPPNPHVSVALTLAFEIAGLQLTSSFRVSTVQIRPRSRLAVLKLSGGGAPALPADVSFELNSVKLSEAGQVATWMLRPLRDAEPSLEPQIRPEAPEQPLLIVGGVEVTAVPAPIAVTAAVAGATAIQVVAETHVAALEFSPDFEVQGVRLDSDSTTFLLRLANPDDGALALPPAFTVTHVDVTTAGQISLITLSPTTKLA